MWPLRPASVRRAHAAFPLRRRLPSPPQLKTSLDCRGSASFEGIDRIKEVYDHLLRALPDLLVLIVSLMGQVAGIAWLIGWSAARASRTTKTLIAAAGGLSMAASCITFLLRFRRVAAHFPRWWISWGTGISIAWAML